VKNEIWLERGLIKKRSDVMGDILRKVSRTRKHNQKKKRQLKKIQKKIAKLKLSLKKTKCTSKKSNIGKQLKNLSDEYAKMDKRLLKKYVEKEK